MVFLLHAGAGAPRESRALGARAHGERNDLHFVAGIWVDASLCFWCLGASNLHVGLVFLIFYYCGVSPIEAGRCPQRVRGSGGKGTCRKE